MNETYDKLIRIDATADGVGCASENTETYSDHYWRRVFAGQAMQGLLSNPHATVEMGVLPRTHVIAVMDRDAARAEGYADALLYRLRKRETEDGHQT